jgi:hypothetical protein
MLRRVALVTTDVSEEHSAPIITTTIIGELGTTIAVTSNKHALPKKGREKETTRKTKTQMVG